MWGECTNRHFVISDDCLLRFALGFCAYLLLESEKRSILSISQLANFGAYHSTWNVTCFKLITLFRSIISAVSCIFIIFFVLSSETRRDDYTELVRGFTSLIILVDLDNNLTFSYVTGNLNN